MKVFKHGNKMSASAPSLTATATSNNNSTTWKQTRDKNRYGSLDDLQAYALHTHNHTLTTKLVEAKSAWEALQAKYRANTHARFLYQTTLARIVNHVQDFSDQDDPVQLQLLCDLLKWSKECEHLVAQQNNTLVSHLSSSTTTTEDSNSQEILPSSSDSSTLKMQHGSHGVMSGSNRTPIIDYNDVQVYVDTSLQAHAASTPFLSHHESLQEQNDNLTKEIRKWHASMTRIRVCNQREANELRTHQQTLRKVVDRILESDFGRKDQIQEWYAACQEQGERCRGGSSRSFSEQDAKLCRRCSSRLCDDDNKLKKDNPETSSGVPIYAPEEEAKTPFPPSSFPPPKTATSACPDTPTTVASHSEEMAATTTKLVLEEADERGVERAVKLAHDAEHQRKNAAAIQAEHKLKESLMQTSRSPDSTTHVDDIALANVEDPPDRIARNHNATNLQETSIVQDKQQDIGCGTCCVM